MPESQDNASSQERRSRRPSEVRELFNGKDPSLSDPERCQIVLRQLTEDGEFARTVKCSPGSITILPSGREARKFEAFRQALLGKPHQHNVTIRLGSYDLHRSEIHVVSNSDVVEPGATVRDMFNSAGVAEESHYDLAAAVGLTDSLDEPTEELPPQAVTRLAITCAFCSRCRIVFVDTPFADVGNEWIPALANFMLQSIVASNRIIIVTGIERLPRIWKSSPFVEMAGVEVGTRDGDTLIIEETMGYLRKIRHLIGTAHSAEDTIFTYPQRIFRTRTPSGAQIRAEAIQNPNFSESNGLDISHEEDSGVHSTLPPQTRVDVAPDELQLAIMPRRYNKMPKKDNKKPSKKRSKNSLTRVSRLHRMRNASTVRRIRKAVKGRQEGTSSRSGLPSYRVDRERDFIERQRELQIMLLTLIMVIAILLLLNWV